MLIDSHRTDHVVGAESHPVDVHDEDVRLGEVPLSQFLEQTLARLDELA